MTKRDPAMGGRARPRPRMEWDMQALLDRCDEVGNCLIWRLALNTGGAPVATVDGVPGKAMRRVVYTQIHGKTIQPGRIIRPKCGNPRCLSEHCLRQVTRSEMQSEVNAVMKSTAVGARREQMKAVRAGFAKLNPEIAAEIRASSEDKDELAKRLNVHESTIRRIRAGTSWAVHSTPSSIFNLAASMGVA